MGILQGVWSGLTGDEPQGRVPSFSGMIPPPPTAQQISDAIALGQMASQPPGTPGAISPQQILGGIPGAAQLMTGAIPPAPLPSTAVPSTGQPMLGAAPAITAAGPARVPLPQVPVTPPPYHDWLNPGYNAQGQPLHHFGTLHNILANVALMTRAGRGLEQLKQQRYYKPYEEALAGIGPQLERAGQEFAQNRGQASFALQKQIGQTAAAQRQAGLAQGLAAVQQRAQEMNLSRARLGEQQREFQNTFGIRLADLQARIGSLALQTANYNLSRQRLAWDQFKTTNPVLSHQMSEVVQRQHSINVMQQIINQGPDKWNSQTASAFESAAKAAGFGAEYQLNVGERAGKELTGRVGFGLASSFARTMPTLNSAPNQFIMERMLGYPEANQPPSAGGPQVKTPGGLTPK